MNYSQELDQLSAALAAAQGEFATVPKDSANPFFKSSYSSFAAVKAAAGPVLLKHGLAVAQFIGLDPTGCETLTTWLLHQSGQYMYESAKLHMTKTDAQSQGSAVTYNKRYSYMAVLGLVSDEDDDGQAASLPPSTAASPTAQRTTRVSSPRSRSSADSPTAGQPNMRKLFAMLKGIGVTEEGRHEWASAALDRTVDSFTTLSTEDVTLLEKKAKEQQLSKTTYSDEDPERPF